MSTPSQPSANYPTLWLPGTFPAHNDPSPPSHTTTTTTQASPTVAIYNATEPSVKELHDGIRRATRRQERYSTCADQINQLVADAEKFAEEAAAVHVALADLAGVVKRADRAPTEEEEDAVGAAYEQLGVVVGKWMGIPDADRTGRA